MFPWFTRRMTNEELIFEPLKTKRINTEKNTMNTSKIALIAIATSLIASVANADSAKANKPSPEAIVAAMFAHDQNSDGVLNRDELAASIEGLYEHRKEAKIDRRNTLVSSGALPEAIREKGIITLNLLPEDGAAIVMKDADSNADQALDAQELVNSIGSLRKLDLGPRRGIARQS